VIKQLYISDLHFGKSRIDPIRLRETLLEEIAKEIEDVQIIFFCGDMFNQMLFLDHPAAYQAILFITGVLHLAKQHNVIVRFLRGTYTHDREQQRIIDGLGIQGVNYRVINEIYVETISDWNNNDTGKLKILYLPDSLPYRNIIQIYNKIKELYTLVGWDKCDLIIGHGAFSHCFPEHIKLPPCVYTVNDINQFVSGYVVMGHIHTPSKKENVIYVGSFERMSHGEEEKKGYLIGYKDQDHWKFKFKENKQATLFITMYPKEHTKENLLNEVYQFIENKFPNQTGYLRIIHHDPEFKSIILNICYQKYPNIKITFKNDTTHKSEMELDECDIDATLEVDTLSIENIAAHITDVLAKDSIYGTYHYGYDEIRNTLEILSLKK